MSHHRIYFASDLHLGIPNEATSTAREKRFIKWLHQAAADATEIYILGDIFDFWYEYKTVVPKGFVRVQAAMAAITDRGIPVHIFTGNHDLWMDGYLEKELGVKLHTQPIVREWNGQKFLIGHGDGLGPGDHGYKFIKKVFTNPLCRWLFRWLHPDLGVPLARFLSHRSRYAGGDVPEQFLGEDKEWLVQYCHSILKQQHYHYFIFGHRHLPLSISLAPESRYLNTGDWLRYNSYVVFDGAICELKYATEN